MLLTILGILGPLLGPLLSKLGVSATLNNLITAALDGAAAIVTGIQNKASVNVELATLQAALTALQADTSLDPTVLGDIAEGIRDLQAAITAYQAAELNTDPSTLTPLPLVP
jgi:hypothetical protein